ncbi:hypothetical protein [Ochrovirga pacifica]|uniref:hypothetical protein n=1 Tax=Ochrovirga pacifica TaxID=1042376 RepID=UPI0002557BAC|nr:hypothetical protein [Ochrovirga pacifica]
MIEKIVINSELNIQYSSTILLIKKQWEKVKPPSVYLSFSYLKALEESKYAKMLFGYIVVFKNNNPIGVIYLQQIQISPLFFNQPKFPDSLKSKIRTYLLKKLNGNLLLCGNFFSTGAHGFYFKDYSVKKTLNSIMDVLVERLKQKRKIDFIVFKEFHQQEELWAQHNLNNWASKFQIDVNMVLTLNQNWNCFQDYLNQMTTKYRTRAKSVYKKTNQVAVVEFTAQNIINHQQRIDELLQSVIQTSSFYLIEPSAYGFYMLKKELENRFVFKAYFYDDTLVAFSTGCHNYTSFDANFVGIDYQTNQQIPLYQRLLYDYVATSIELKALSLQLGRTAELMKSSLGAVPVGMNLYAKHQQACLNRLLSPLLSYVKPSAYEIRNPFKQPKTVCQKINQPL